MANCQPTMQMSSTHNPASRAVPRPYSEWIIYFALERDYIYQKILKVPSNRRKKFDPFDPSYLSLFSSTTGPPLPVPRRYEGIELPDKFYTVYKDGTPKVKNNDAIISRQDLSNMVSKNWESADDETKEFVRVMHLIEMEQYNRRYAESCTTSRQKTGQNHEQIMAKIPLEEVYKQISNSASKETEAKQEVASECRLELHASQNQTDTMQESNDLAGDKRMAESEMGSNVPIKKRPRWPFEQSHHNDQETARDEAEATGRSSVIGSEFDSNQKCSSSTLLQQGQMNNAVMTFQGQQNNDRGRNQNENSIMKARQYVLDARSRALNDIIKHSRRTGQPPDLQFSQPFDSPVMVNPCMAFQAPSAAVAPGGQLYLPATSTTHAKVNHVNYDKARAAASRGESLPALSQITHTHVVLNNVHPDETRATTSGGRTKMHLNSEDVYDHKNSQTCSSRSDDDACVRSPLHDTQAVAAEADRSAHGAFRSGSIHRPRRGSAGASNTLLGISKPDQQGGDEHDAINKIQKETNLSDWEVRLLLARGAKSIAEDAARYVNGDVARPTPEATKAAIKYLEIQSLDKHTASADDAMSKGNLGHSEKGGPRVNSSTQLGRRSVETRSDSTIGTAPAARSRNPSKNRPRANPSNQLGQLTAEARSNIATVAAAATAAGLRLLPPSEGSKEELRTVQNGRASISEVPSPTASTGPSSTCPSEVNNLSNKEAKAGQNTNVASNALALSVTSFGRPNNKAFKPTSRWTAHQSLLNSMKTESTRSAASEFQLQQSLLDEVVKKNQKLQAAMEAKYRAVLEATVTGAARRPATFASTGQANVVANSQSGSARVGGLNEINSLSTADASQSKERMMNEEAEEFIQIMLQLQSQGSQGGGRSL